MSVKPDDISITPTGPRNLGPEGLERTGADVHPALTASPGSARVYRAARGARKINLAAVVSLEDVLPEPSGGCRVRYSLRASLGGPVVRVFELRYDETHAMGVGRQQLTEDLRATFYADMRAVGKSEYP